MKEEEEEEEKEEEEEMKEVVGSLESICFRRKDCHPEITSSETKNKDCKEGE